jgi:hypothetical protein
VDTNPSLTALLLVARTLGDQNIIANHEAFKGFKKELAQAQEEGLLATGNASVPTVGKDGTTKMKKAKVLSVTEAGAAYLQHAASPEAQAAARVGEVAAELEKDRAALREQVLASIKPTGKAKADPSKEIKEIAKQVAKMSERLEKLEANLQSDSPSGILDHIDAAFAKLSAKLTGSAASVAHAVPTAPKPQAAAPAPVPTQHAAKSVAQILEETYRELVEFKQYEDGIIDLPRLYHQAKEKHSSLTVAAFQSELQSLWSQRVLELKILNEVRKAAEPELGVRQNDSLYYYVFWHLK